MLLPVLAVATLTLPAEVRAYVARRDACEHFAGEDAYDAERGRFLNAQVARNRCLTLDRDRRRLRVKFVSPAIRRELRPLAY